MTNEFEFGLELHTFIHFSKTICHRIIPQDRKTQIRCLKHLSLREFTDIHQQTTTQTAIKAQISQ